MRRALLLARLLRAAGVRDGVRLVAVLLAVGCCASACGTRRAQTIEIGVLLPRTPTFEEPLSWALDNVNRPRVDGKKIELVYAADPTSIAAARRLADDPSIAAVIGPESSNEVFADADLFVAARKPLVTPSATSADIFRAFSQTGYVWRTVESDVGQVQAVLRDAARTGAHSVALLTGTDLYGSTFFDWFGFSARELGIRVTSVTRYDQSRQSCATPLRKVLATHPDLLLAVPSTTAATVCIARRAHGTRLVFADAGEDPAALAALGPSVPLRGVAPAPAPDSGFGAAFRQRFGHDAPAYAAQTYDALTLLAYGLERAHGAPLARALAQVVAARGPRTTWTADGIRAALTRPGANVTGAGGALDYHLTDPVSTAYATWRSAGSGFATAPSVVVSATSTPTPRLRQHLAPRSRPVPPRHGIWALLVAASSGEQNYRHQADVLAQYQVLRANGVPDDHIVLVLADDLGPVVRYENGGANLHRNVHIDYRLGQVDAQGLLDILAGRSSSAYPTVLHARPDDDVYVYIAGHGDEHGVYIGLNSPVPLFGAYTLLAPKPLAATVDAMSYRRLLIAVEACQSGVLGEALHAPNALLLAAANPVENSLSANYDAKTGTWLADAFSFDLWRAEQTSPGQTLGTLYTRLYLSLAGQHVSAYGSGADASLRDFIG